MPRRSSPTAKRSSRGPSSYKRADEIVAERNQLTAELARLQSVLGASSRFGAQARDLLTRQWAKADWNARQGLLKAAHWLVQLEIQAAGVDF